MILHIVLSTLLFLLFIVVLYIQQYKHNKNWTVYQVDQEFNITKDSDELYSPFNELFSTVNKINDARLIFFTDYGDIDNNIEKINYPKDAYIYAIRGSDLMASKSNLASFFQYSKLEKYIPLTYILSHHDLSGLSEDNGAIYFLKKNVQRQEGTLITKDVKYIKEKAREDGYVVCQELLQNPLLINKRKINMRVYMLITSSFGKIDFYFYNNGFIYYTPKYFEKNSIETDVNITTGYIDRQVYIDNPLTHKNMYDLLGDEKSIKLKENINEFFKNFKDVYKTQLESNNTMGNRFNVFGVDIAPDENYKVTIMEVNKAPDLSYKDKRDSEVKLNMVKDMMNLMGILDDGNKDNFIKV
jgi:hypothetical protein